MTIVPQSLASEVIDSINALISDSDRFRNWDDADVQAVVRAIEKLQKADAREAFVCFGTLAAICGNVDDMLSYYQKALRLPSELETKHEFFTSLGNAGMYGKAREVSTWLLDPKKGFFPGLWRLAMGFGNVVEVWDRVSDAKKTYPDLSEIEFSLLENAVVVMKAHGLSDLDIVAVLDLAGEIQRAHRIMFAGEQGAILKVMKPPEDPPYLYFSIPLDTTVDEIHAMNRELARGVVEKLPSGAFPRGMVATFAKAATRELLAAA